MTKCVGELPGGDKSGSLAQVDNALCTSDRERATGGDAAGDVIRRFHQPF